MVTYSVLHSSFVRPYFRSLTSLRSTIRAVSPPFGEEPWCRVVGLIAIREVSPPFGQLRGRTTSTRLSKKKIRLFLYKERKQIWNITVNRYITRNNMQVQFIRFRQKISPLFRLCFIQCNIAHSRFAKRHIQSRTHINRTFRT